uniref:Uncharacterized protein n=1 Tax=Macaca fascicularis TaxID=9541 RepID=Q95K94_MACFA|nr:hypothetical protein [Macaca fascicularis]
MNNFSTCWKTLRPCIFLVYWRQLSSSFLSFLHSDSILPISCNFLCLVTSLSAVSMNRLLLVSTTWLFPHLESFSLPAEIGFILMIPQIFFQIVFPDYFGLR